MRFALLSILGLSFAGVVVAQTPQAAAATVLTNTMCPVLSDEAVDPGIYVDYRGKRVYFCCKRCQRKFIEDPEQYAANLPWPAPTPPAATAAAAPPPAESVAPPEEKVTGLARVERFLGEVHPLVVHFPIALLLAAALAQLFVYGGKPWEGAVRYCLYLGALGAVVAAGLGLCA